MYKVRDGKLGLYINNPAELDEDNSGLYNLSFKLFLKNNPDLNQTLSTQILLEDSCSNDIPLLDI